MKLTSAVILAGLYGSRTGIFLNRQHMTVCLAEALLLPFAVALCVLFCLKTAAQQAEIGKKLVSLQLENNP